jgi:ABC-type phosphate/phosphonate transport system permease subunit
MISVWAIIVVALVGSTPVTELVASFETQSSCEFAVVEFVTEIKPKLREDVLAFGAGCVKVNMTDGKPI